MTFDKIDCGYEESKKECGCMDDALRGCGF